MPLCSQLGAGPCSNIDFKLLYTLPAHKKSCLTTNHYDLATMELTSTMLNSRSSSLVSCEASPMSRAKLANLQMTKHELSSSTVWVW